MKSKLGIKIAKRNTQKATQKATQPSSLIECKVFIRSSHVDCRGTLPISADSIFTDSILRTIGITCVNMSQFWLYCV